MQRSFPHSIVLRVDERRFYPLLAKTKIKPILKPIQTTTGVWEENKPNLKPTKKMYKEGSEGKTIGPVGLKTGAVGGAHDHHSSAGQYNIYAGDFW